MARLTTPLACCLIGAAFATVLLGACGKTDTPVLASVAAPATAPAAQVDDADVTTKVTTSLMSDGILKGFNIRVVVTKGDVRLIGTVDTQEQVDSAKAIARATPGAHSIHDELVLKR